MVKKIKSKMTFKQWKKEKGARITEYIVQKRPMLFKHYHRLLKVENWNQRIEGVANRGYEVFESIERFSKRIQINPAHIYDEIYVWLQKQDEASFDGWSDIDEYSTDEDSGDESDEKKEEEQEQQLLPPRDPLELNVVVHYDEDAETEEEDAGAMLFGGSGHFAGLER